jgi:hypothetical protein
MAGFLNTGMMGQAKGYDERLDHYDRWGWLWEKPIYEITINQSKPLTYIDTNGDLWQPDFHFLTDFGSIPPPLQSVPGLDRERFANAYLFHDSSYTHKGLWMLNSTGNYRFVGLERKKCDEMLKEMIRFEMSPGNVVLAGIIYRAVRLFGGSGYGRGDYRGRNSPPCNTLDLVKPLPGLA